MSQLTLDFPEPETEDVPPPDFFRCERCRCDYGGGSKRVKRECGGRLVGWYSDYFDSRRPGWRTVGLGIERVGSP